MGEEVLSPTTPNASRSPPQHQIQLSQNRSIRPGNATLDSQKYQIPMPSKGERGSKEQKEEGANKSRWPGLNVVTNFSKPPTLAQKAGDRAAGRDTSQGQGLALKRHDTAGPLARSMTVESLGIRHQRSGTQTSLKPSKSKGRLGDLSRQSSKWSNLSPSDRAVVIGISVSPEELAEHSASPEASGVEPKGLTEQYALDRRPSIAPSILITPAKDIAPWSAVEDDQFQEQRKRAASSVYSQLPPQNGGRIIDSDIVPPIPPLPPDAKKHYAQVNGIDEKHEKNSHAGIDSTCTVYDEDGAENTMMGARTRSDSGGSHLRIITKQSSIDTIATKHRSQGWWNHIVSPFFPKSPMTFKFGSNTPTKPEPATPTPLEAPAAGHDQETRKSRRQSFSPRATKSEGPESPHTSWTDSSIDAEFEKRALPGDDRRETFIEDEPQEMPPLDSAALLSKFQGFGLAAEYYEACLYDMHSETPYFECQNHSCLPARMDSRSPPAVQEGGSTRGIDAGPNTLFDLPRQAEQSQPLAAQQAPTNRFSAAFHEALAPGPQERPQSDATVIEDWDGTPVVREAHVAPIVRAPEPVPAAQPPIPEPELEPQPARAIGELLKPAEVTPCQPPAYPSPKKPRMPKKYVAVMPPDRTPAPYETDYGQPMSPQPVTPAVERSAAKDAIVMNEVRRKPLEVSTMQGARDHNYYRRPETAQPEDQVSVSDLYPPPRPRHESPAPRAWEVKEKGLPPRQPNKSREFPKCRSCFSSAKPKNKKEKIILWAIAAGLVLLIVLILVLCMTLNRKGNETPVQSQWLNLTGFPPIPTGVSTIVQPNNILADSDCVEPSTMWSCAVPKEEQQGISPNAPDQPNFRVEIMFQNGTNATSNATATNASDINRRSYGHIVNPVSAGSFIRNRLLLVRSAFNSNSYAPSPAPPTLEDQIFLGNITDGNAAPFDGEYTPFFMSFEAATKLSSSRILKRQSSTSSRNNSDSDPFPDPTKAIPPPSTKADGTAASATLHPTPSSQPLRLYDRGLDTEHYGFYTYFDRSIFLKSSAPSNPSANATAPVPDDEDGGSSETEAAVRCTWAQTRFLVQIWTKKQGLATLLDPAANTTSPSKPTRTSTSQNTTSLSSSSANDFTQPGSFPYPVTITLDRHGGDINSKMIYCYGLDNREHVITSEKKIQLEDRGVGGHLVNPALGPFGDVNVTRAQGGPGGIDGGNGGCGCRWVNWQ